MQNGDPARSNLVIAPHLDDAVFSLGGLLIQEPRNTKVITVFAGIPRTPVLRLWDRICGFHDSTRAVETRIQENDFALQSVGISKENSINLSYVDRQYRRPFLNLKGESASTLTEIKKNVMSELRSLMEKEKAGTVRIFAPMLGAHQDHAIVRDAVMELHTALQGTPARFEFYLYQDLPYFYVYYMRKLCDRLKSKKEVMQNLEPEGVPGKRCVFELSEQEFLKKIEACKLYASQFHSKIFGFHSLFRQQRTISFDQAEILKTKSRYCEVVYKIE